MKIAILADPLDNQNAGVHVYTRQLIDALAHLDTTNEYILIRENKETNLPFQQYSIPNVRLPIGFGTIRMFILVPLLLRKLNVNIVFEPAHFGPFNLPKKVKRVAMIHDLTPILFPQFHRFHSQLLQRIFLKKILKKTDLILSNSNHTKCDIERIYPFTSTKIKSILLGRNEKFKPVENQMAIQHFQIRKPYFLCVGTIEPRKNHKTLLKAFEQYQLFNKRAAQLVITGGKGWKSDDFYQEIEKHPFKKDIILTGYISEDFLLELYSHSLAMIYPSLYEGFGFPILEALSSGTICISSNTSSMPEVGGDAALYFNPLETSELLELMKKVSQFTVEQRKTIINKGLEQANNFSWKEYAKEFDKMMSELGK
jgi:glycosyltransferase involved in cell wall biosynthesis